MTGDAKTGVKKVWFYIVKKVWFYIVIKGVY